MMSPTTPLINNPHRSKKHFVLQLLQGFVVVAVAISLIAVIYVTTKSDSAGAPNQLLRSAPEYSDPNPSPVLQKTSYANEEDDGEEEVPVVLDGPIVDTKNGQVRGKKLISSEGREYTAFYNIPYALPPTGNRRFKAPQPLTAKWEGVRDGTVQGGEESECLQVKHDEVSGSEDCLYLHVFTPKLPRRLRRNPKLPVMFYILGGAYIFGRANRYGADYMMNEDVILVLVDYRYGALGHLNSEDGEISGNQAFKDQVMALRWVQENIKKFGGDRKRVLIFGNSSGGASVHALIISPMARGLFSSAISQSGSVVLNPQAAKQPIDSVRELGEKLNCTDLESTKALHQCFLAADGADIARNKLEDMLFITKDSFKEGEENTEEIFMPDYPMNLLERGEFDTSIPWILGSNSAESYMVALELLRLPEILNLVNRNWDQFAPPLLHFDNDVDGNASRSLRQFYFGSKDISLETRENLTNCLSDSAWVWAVSKAGNLHAKHGGKAYYYLITHEPVQSYGQSSKEGFEGPYGVAHADEVQFFFPFEPFPYIGKNSSDYKFSRQLIKIWTEFARTGEVSLKDWKPLDPDPSKSKWMDLNENPKMMDPLSDRLNFLQDFPFQVPDFI